MNRYFIEWKDKEAATSGQGWFSHKRISDYFFSEGKSYMEYCLVAAIGVRAEDQGYLRGI